VFPVNVEMPRVWPSERQKGPRPRSGRWNSRGSRAASAASKRATRGTARRVVPTAERSHRPSQCASVATQSTLCPGQEASLFWPKIEIRAFRTANPMRPLRGRRIWVPGSAGRARRAQRASARPAEPPAASHRPRSGRIVSPNARRWRRSRRCVPAKRHLSLAEDRDSVGWNCEPNATAPRSAYPGSGIRGSRACSLRSPTRDPRLFYRPLRGRGPSCLSRGQCSEAP